MGYQWGSTRASTGAPPIPLALGKRNVKNNTENYRAVKWNSITTSLHSNRFKFLNLSLFSRVKLMIHGIKSNDDSFYNTQNPLKVYVNNPRLLLHQQQALYCHR